MNITEKIAALEATINSASSELEKLKQELNKPAFEVGKWYKHKPVNRYPYWFYFQGYGVHTYGFDNEMRFKERIAGNISEEDFGKYYIPATDKEVEEALIKEAIKRGFKEGVVLNIDCRGYLEQDLKRFAKGNFIFDAKNNELYINSLGIYDPCVIFRDGKWAKIIKDEPITIGGYEVMFSKHTKDTKIDGNLFTQEFWQAAKIVAEHSKAGVNVGCSKQFPVSLDIINQILDKL